MAVEKLPERYGFLVRPEERGLRHHRHEDAAGGENVVGGEDVVDVLLLGKGRIHHDPAPLMVDAIILGEVQKVDADHSGVGLAFEVAFHVPVELQTIQHLNASLKHDVGQVALSAGRLQDNTGAVQLGHLAHQIGRAHV